MTGEQRIAAPRAKVWDALNDPEILRQCVPGCQSLDKTPDGRMDAIVEIRIGPIGARFKGAVTLSDLDPPNAYTISGEGQGGTVGFAKGGARVRLAEDGGATLLSYEVEAQIGGRLAQLGGPIIDATARQLAGKFFDTFGALVADGDAPVPAKAARASTSVLSTASPAPSGIPVAWMLALVLAALTGFLVGRGQGGAEGSDWMGLAIGLLVLIVTAVGFAFGRRAAAPVVVLDPVILSRLARMAEENRT